MGFIPATPGGLLAKEIQKVVTEESSRIGLRAKIVEKGGRSLKNELVKMDLTGCFYTDCYLCQSGMKGGSHTRAGAHYSGLCMICEETGIVSRYDGETGRSAYWRTNIHQKEIKNNNKVFRRYVNASRSSKVAIPDLTKFQAPVNKI